MLMMNKTEFEEVNMIDKRKFYSNVVSEFFIFFAGFFAFFGKSLGIIPKHISTIDFLIILIIPIIIWNEILRFINKTSKINGKISETTSKRILNLFKLCFLLFLIFATLF